MAAGHATKEMAAGVVARLREAGHEALLAGGCVRDMLLGIPPADYDVATSATPQQVKALFRRVLMVGAKFGVAMVILHRRRVEVTTFRCDVSYSDGRRPDGVRFVTAREDALRRDFTINGMFYDPRGRRVVDYVGGQADLAAGVIRAIGQPQVRFGEDYLRMLRAVRFSARFGFPIEPATARAVRQQAGRIVQISGERIHDELQKMLAHPSAAQALRQMHELGLLEAVLPELFAGGDRLPAALYRVERVARRCDCLLTLGALLCRLPASDLRRISRRWGASNRQRDSLVWLAEHLDDWPVMPQAPLADLKRLRAWRDFPRLERLWRLEERLATDKDVAWQAIRRRLDRIDPRQVAPPPLIGGADLKRLGLEEGPRLGEVRAAVYEAQLNEAVATRRQALALARRLLRQG